MIFTERTDRNEVTWPQRGGQTFTAVITLSGRVESDTSWSTETELEEADGYWVAADPATGVFGSGATPEEAVADFEVALRETLDVLTRQPELSEDLSAQLRALQRRLH